MIPVNETPKRERSTPDLCRELEARLADTDRGLGNRVQIAQLREELDRRARGGCQVLVVRVEPHVLEQGLWCDHCALPSAIRVVVTLANNPTRWMADKVICTDCGAEQ